jgi:hypothetical protein
VESLKPIVRSVPFLLFLAFLAPILQNPASFYEPRPFPLPCLPQAHGAANHTISQDLYYHIAAITGQIPQVTVTKAAARTAFDTGVEYNGERSEAGVNVADPRAYVDLVDANTSSSGYKVRNIQVLINGGSSSGGASADKARPAIIPAVYYKSVTGPMTAQFCGNLRCEEMLD